MNWINIETKTMRSPEFIGSEPEQRATWLCLLAYCAEQENGGKIADCRDWKTRRWQQTCGVTTEEVSGRCDLWAWEGDSLAVWGYPIEKEHEVRLKREGGQRGGKARAKNAANKAIAGNATSIIPSIASSPPSSPPSTEEKRREEKGKELSLERASESESFSDNLPTAAVGGMEAIAAKICSLRPEWSRIALSYSERQIIIHNAASLHSVSSSDWRAIGDYLRATIPEGRPAWQPRNRSKFVETISDVLGYALEWQRRRSPGPTLAQVLVPVKVVTPEERAETMNEFKQVFGKVTA